MKTELFYRQRNHESLRARIRRIRANRERLATIQKRVATIQRVSPAKRTTEVKREYERLKAERKRIINPSVSREATQRWTAKNKEERRVYNAAYYRENRDRLIKVKAEYIARHYREFLDHARAYQKASGYKWQKRYRALHAAVIAARARMRRKKQPEKVRADNKKNRARQAEWHKAHPEKMRAFRAGHRQRVKERRSFAAGLK